jgi:hypothetical protein
MLGDAPPDPLDKGLLHVAADLRRRGVEPARRGSVGQREYVQVRRGVWIRVEDWEVLPPVTRHAAFVHATALGMDPESEAVFSHESAAALWGMPRIEQWPAVAHVTTLRPVRSSAKVRRHECELDAYLVREGRRVTTPARTVVDLARTGSFVTALAAADFALRHRLTVAENLVEEAHDVPLRARGRAAARLVAELADGRSMSAGESLSRAQMFVLNLPRPHLQVECRDELGLIGYADFGWHGVVGEFDGQVKYRVPAGADPQEAGRAVWREKQREDRIRAQGTKVARWVYADAIEPARMARKLAEQGVPPQPRNTWLDLGSRST